LSFFLSFFFSYIINKGICISVNDDIRNSFDQDIHIDWREVVQVIGRHQVQLFHVQLGITGVLDQVFAVTVGPGLFPQRKHHFDRGRRREGTVTLGVHEAQGEAVMEPYELFFEILQKEVARRLLAENFVGDGDREDGRAGT